MLAELAAANAAFQVIKTAVQNGKEIASAGKAIANFVGAKEQLQRKAQKKGGGSDLEEFMALEQIREQEEQLKQIMIYAGRPGLWGDWQRFQAKARIARREAEEAAIRKRKKIWTSRLSQSSLFGLVNGVLIVYYAPQVNYNLLAKHATL